MKQLQHGVRFLLAAGLTGLALSSCGYKDKPVPPQKIVPKPISDLSYQLEDGGATLRWTYPGETITGDKLARIRDFKLYRAVVPVADYCAGCPIPFSDPVKLDGGALPGEGGRSGSYREPVLRPGNLYFYKIRSSNSWLAESKDSNIVSFRWDSPGAAPENLRVESAGNVNTLSWSGVTRNQDGTPLDKPVRYQVFRKTGEGAFVKLGEPVAATRVVDESVRHGTSYTYRVQALSEFGEDLVEGGSSAEVAVTTLDRTAPPAPPKPEVVASQTGVRVYWAHVEADDLAGYRVYRRGPGESTAKLVGTVDLPYNMFIDKQAPKGRSHYSVSSIDDKNPPNESRRSPEGFDEEQ